MRIRYVGKKPFYLDGMFHTNVLWMGHGDVQEVEDDEIAAGMCKYAPLVYEEVPGEPEGGQLVMAETAAPGVVVPGVGTAADPLADPPALVPAAYDVIEHETVQEFDGTVVKLKDASYRAVQRYLADVLHIKMSRPTRTKMLEAIKGLRKAEVEAKLNAASQE